MPFWVVPAFGTWVLANCIFNALVKPVGVKWCREMMMVVVVVVVVVVDVSLYKHVFFGDLLGGKGKLHTVKFGSSRQGRKSSRK